MKHPVLGIIRAGLAGGLVAAALPLAAAPAMPSVSAAAEYGGFASSGWATPIRIEVYEPSIPIPHEPQAEVDVAYSMVKADSGLSQGRGSWLWPGDPVGEGLPTFGEQMGLPEELYKDGYQVQVNSKYPSDSTSQADEPFPGTLMRTSSGENRARAEVGFSSDGTPNDADETDDGSGGGDDGDGTGDPVTDLLDQLGGLGGPGDSVGAAEDDPESALPPELAALIDVEGMISTSRTNAADGPVTAASRASLGEIRLLEGLLTIGGVDVRAKATTDGATGAARGRATYGALSLNGTEFSLGPDGAVADGEPTGLPGLADLPGDALAQLGITFEVPEPVREVDGDQATSVSEALRIYLDLEAFSAVMEALPAAQLAEIIPEDAGPLKGLVSGLNNFTPLIVITLGTATAAVDTVPPVELPPVPDVDEAAPPATGGSPDAGVEAGGAGAGAPADVTPQPTASNPEAAGVGTLPDTLPASSNLPPLFSIPGMLLLAALVLGGVVGNWMRIMGAKVLAGGAACTHGLDAGVPDLRKA